MSFLSPDPVPTNVYRNEGGDPSGRSNGSTTNSTTTTTSTTPTVIEQTQPTTSPTRRSTQRTTFLGNSSRSSGGNRTQPSLIGSGTNTRATTTFGSNTLLGQ